MGGALARLAKENQRSSTKPWLNLVTGTCYTALGVGAAFDRSEEPRSSVFRGLAVTESLVIGGALLGDAVLGFAAGPSIDGGRYARFQRDRRTGNLSEARLAQYEGELYADAQISASLRRLSGWVNFGVGVAGAGLIAIAATSDMRGSARALTYVEGAVIMPAGLITGIVELESQSSNEREWRNYRLGAAAGSPPRLSMAPILLPNGLLLTGGGRF